jgi:putative membrane protein
VVPPEPTLRSLALGWTFDPASALVVAVAAGLWVAGVRRLAARGRAWPTGRSVAFAGGLATIVIATHSGLARYEGALFSAHSAQHVLLGMVAPALLALAAPMTLALQASSRATTTVLLRLIHSGPLAVLTHPAAAWGLFGGTLFALYFTAALEWSVRNDLFHVAVHLHFVVAGTLFCWTAIGIDPTRWRLPYGARLAYVLLALPVHAILGLALLEAEALVGGGIYGEVAPAWLADPLADQRLGAGILWGAGELWALALAGVVLAQWVRADAREARRIDRILDAERAERARTEGGGL